MGAYRCDLSCICDMTTVYANTICRLVSVHNDAYGYVPAAIQRELINIMTPSYLPEPEF